MNQTINRVCSLCDGELLYVALVGWEIDTQRFEPKDFYPEIYCSSCDAYVDDKEITVNYSGQ